MANIDWYLKIYSLAGKNPVLDQLMIFGAVYIIFLAAILAIFIAIYLRGQELKALIVALLGIPIAEILINFISVYYFEPRPFVSLFTTPLIRVTIDPSYPSHHTSIMAILLFSFLLCRSKFWVLFLILTLWVGFARVYAGVHYPLDIIAGIMIGFIASYLSKLILIWTKRKLL